MVLDSSHWIFSSPKRFVRAWSYHELRDRYIISADKGLGRRSGIYKSQQSGDDVEGKACHMQKYTLDKLLVNHAVFFFVTVSGFHLKGQ